MARDSRDPSYLYNGILLEAAASAAARIGADPAHHAPLSRTEQDFLDASDRAHRRGARRRQGIIAFLVALVLGLTAVTWVAYSARQVAVQRQDTAVAGEVAVDSETLGDTDPTLAKLESLAAWRINPSAQTRYAMLTTAALPGITILTSHYGAVYALAFSPDGKTLATGNYGGAALLWNTTTHQQIGRALTSGHTVDSVAFSPDGKTLATGNTDSHARLWNVATHQQIGQPLTGNTGPVNAVAFSPDGKTLATGNYDSTDRLWDVDFLSNPQRWLCLQVGRSLTPTEWTNNIPSGPPYMKVCS